MAKKKKQAINWVGVSLGVVGAGAVYLTIDTWRKVNAMQELSYKLQNFRLEKSGDDLRKLNFVVEVTNPTNFNYKIKDADLLFLYKNIRLGRFIKDKLIIPPHSRQLVDFPIYVKKGDLNGLITTILTTQSSIVNITGSLRYKGIGIPIAYDLDAKDYLPLLQR